MNPQMQYNPVIRYFLSILTMTNRKDRSAMRSSLKLCVFFFAVLLLFGCSFAGAEDPVVIRVGDVCFTKSQVHPLLQTDIQLAQVIDGVYWTEEERKAQKEATIERIIGVGLIEAKLEDAGQMTLRRRKRQFLRKMRAIIMSSYGRGSGRRSRKAGRNSQKSSSLNSWRTQGIR